jgi:putative membrane protein
MPGPYARFLIHWIATALSLWAASYVFSGIRFASVGALAVAALVLGLVNAILRPVFIILTLPITVLTLGLFLLVLNGMMLMLVAALVHGFVVANFATAIFGSIFISIVSYLIGALLRGAE